MKTELEILAEINNIRLVYSDVLVGRREKLYEDETRALKQLQAETALSCLYWCLERIYKSNLTD